MAQEAELDAVRGSAAAAAAVCAVRFRQAEVRVHAQRKCAQRRCPRARQRAVCVRSSKSAVSRGVSAQ